MAIVTVHKFEMIDVEDGDGEGASLAFLAGMFAAQCVQADAVIRDAGERVVGGLEKKFFVLYLLIPRC